MIRAGAPLVVLFLIGNLQDRASSCSNLFEILHFCSCYTLLSLWKSRIFEKLGRSKLFDTHFVWKRHCLNLFLFDKKNFLKNLARRKLLDPLYISKGNTGFAGFLRNVNCWKIMLCNMNKAAKSTESFLVLDRKSFLKSSWGKKG